MREIKAGAATLGRKATKLIAMVAAPAAAATIVMAGAIPAGAVSSTGRANASAVTYWSFQNQFSRECLTTYSTGKILTLPCDAGSKAQQWQWIKSSWNNDSGSSYRLLKNRWTGKCLISKEMVTSGSCEDWTSRHWENISVDGKINVIRDYSWWVLQDSRYWNAVTLTNTYRSDSKWIMEPRG